MGSPRSGALDYIGVLNKDQTVHRSNFEEAMRAPNLNTRRSQNVFAPVECAAQHAIPRHHIVERDRYDPKGCVWRSEKGWIVTSVAGVANWSDTPTARKRPEREWAGHAQAGWTRAMPAEAV